MSKQRRGAANAVPAKGRRISQAPPPIKPLPPGSGVAPPDAEFERPSAKTTRKISEAEFGFQEVERRCREAIIQLRRAKKVDKRYVVSRWLEILRPDRDHAYDNCVAVEMPADKLEDLRWRTEKVDREWRCLQYLDGNSSNKATRGRPAEYNWNWVKSQLTAYASKNGRVQTMNELLQKCADFAKDSHAEGKTPSDKTIREAIKTHELDVAAGLAPGK